MPKPPFAAVSTNAPPLSASAGASGRGSWAKGDALSLALMLLLGLAVRLYVCWQDPYELADYPFTDDSFYALNIARHLALGDGPTHDGIHLTNGFQPLYVGMMVPVYWLLDGDRIVPLYLAAVLLALCSVAACGFLYLLTRRLFSARAGLLAITPLLFTPYALSRSLNGLETSLYVLLVCVTSFYYVTRFRQTQPRLGTAIGLGVLCGLTVWARLDGGLFVLALALDQLLLRHLPLASGLDPCGGRRGGTWARVEAVAVAGKRPANARCGVTLIGQGDSGGDGAWLQTRCLVFGVAAAMVLPWLALNWLLGGSIVPESGRAVRFLSMIYGGFADGRPPLTYYLGNLREVADVLLRHFLTEGWFLGWLRQGLGLGMATFYGGCTGLLLVCSGWVSRRWGGVLRRPAKCWLQRLAAVRFLLLFSGLLIGAYVGYTFGPWFYGRYLLVVAFILALALGGAADMLLVALAPAPQPPWLRRLGRVAFVVLVVASATTAAVRTRQAGGVSPWCTRIIPWLQQQLPEKASVGSFQTGYLGYFSEGRHVHALDGVVNGQALAALRQRRLIPYLRASGVDYVVDWRWLTQALLYGRSPTGTWTHVTRTHVIPGAHPPVDFVIYRVDH